MFGDHKRLLFLFACERKDEPSKWSHTHSFLLPWNSSTPGMAKKQEPCASYVVLEAWLGGPGSSTQSTWWKHSGPPRSLSVLFYCHMPNISIEMESRKNNAYWMNSTSSWWLKDIFASEVSLVQILNLIWHQKEATYDFKQCKHWSNVMITAKPNSQQTKPQQKASDAVTQEKHGQLLFNNIDKDQPPKAIH